VFFEVEKLPKRPGVDSILLVQDKAPAVLCDDIPQAAVLNTRRVIVYRENDVPVLLGSSRYVAALYMLA
jgi:hypothetical protein